MEAWIFALFLAGFLIFAGWTYSLTLESGERSVRAWAKRNGWSLERCEGSPLHHGPFMVHAHGKQVWAIRARNQEGEIQEGWALSADPLSRDPAGQVEVSWCEPGASAFR